MTADVAHLARAFPLVDRPRPTYPPLAERVAEVTELAREVGESDAVLGATRALNRAALIASDCGLPELAREWCWRQIDPYRRAGHLTVRQAMQMLEPVVNLARLRMRAGDAEGAWASLSTLYHALRTNTDAVIEGRPLPTAGLSGSREEHQELRVWAWRIYLSEGTRALVGLGRWAEALVHIESQKGVGVHLMDGRQVHIVSACLAGDVKTALVVLDGSMLAAPWEYQVGACLAVLCRLAGQLPAGHQTDRMIGEYFAGVPEFGHAVFRARLGMAVADLTTSAAPDRVGRVYARLIEETLAVADGYVAREVLAHAGCGTRLTARQRRALVHAVESSGLGVGAIPAPLLADLRTAVETSETVLTRSLDRVRGTAPAS